MNPNGGLSHLDVRGKTVAGGCVGMPTQVRSPSLRPVWSEEAGEFKIVPGLGDRCGIWKMWYLKTVGSLQSHSAKRMLLAQTAKHNSRLIGSKRLIVPWVVHFCPDFVLR